MHQFSITILTSRDFWSSSNERKPLSRQKCILRKCCGVSQKQWMLELSNLCHSFQHPWKLTTRDFWSSRNERKPLSKQKMCFEKMLWGISEMVNARAFKPLPLCSAKVGSSARFCVLVCKSSLLWYGGPLAKVGSSAKFCVVVCKSSLLWYWWGSSAKVGSSAKFCVAVFKASILNYPTY